MKRKLYAYEYDFMDCSGTRLVLSREQPLRREELHPIELRMLESYPIPNLLKLEIEEIDLNVRLSYDFTGKKMLSSRFRALQLSEQTYFQLFFQLAAILDASKTYMLREEAYWLHEDFIFIGDEIEDIALLYVPVRDVSGKPGAREQLRELAQKLAGPVMAREGGKLTTFLSFLYRETFTFHEMKQVIGSLLTERKKERMDGVPWKSIQSQPTPPAWITAHEAVHDDRPAAETGFRSQLNPQQNLSAPGHMGVLQTVNEDEAEDDRIPDLNLDPEPNDGDQTGGNAHAAALPRKHLTAIGALAAAVLLLLWSFYPDGEEAWAQPVWLGISLLLLDAFFVIVRLKPEWVRLFASAGNWRMDKQPELAGITDYLLGNPDDPEPEPFHGRKASYIARHLHSNGDRPGEKDVEQRAQLFPEPFHEDRTANPMQDRTSLLQPFDQTVLLRPENAGRTMLLTASEPEVPSAYLEISGPDGAERIAIDKKCFVIGREPQLANYVASGAGVSKLHLEIVTEGRSFYAKDLGSRNGSMLNSEKMVPYKLYPLNDGDTLKIAGNTFIFRQTV
jgi:hypothetical protein